MLKLYIWFYLYNSVVFNFADLYRGLKLNLYNVLAAVKRKKYSCLLKSDVKRTYTSLTKCTVKLGYKISIWVITVRSL